jgi:hypothetical protein
LLGSACSFDLRGLPATPAGDAGSDGATPDGADTSAALVALTARGPATVRRDQRNVPVAVDLSSQDDASLPITGLWMSLSRNGEDLATEYQIRRAHDNPIELPARATRTVSFWLDVGTAASLGTVTATVHIELFHAAGAQLHRVSTSFDWAVESGSPPTVTIASPAATARLCSDGAPNVISVDGTANGGGALSYLWQLPGGSPASSTLSSPGPVTYDTPGIHPIWLTVIHNGGGENRAAGPSVFVGSRPGGAIVAHPTGALRLKKPAAGESVAISGLPRSDAIDMDGGDADLVQCDGTEVPTAAARYVTLFSDRGVIDPARDARPELPGVQIALDTGGGHFDNVTMLRSSDPALPHPTPALEGPALFYGEHQRPGDGVVTVAGQVLHSFVGDNEPPALLATWPLACSTPCHGKGERWYLQFNEPMAPEALLAATRVLVSTDTTCAGGATTDVTAQSSLQYDAASRTLIAVPALASATGYSVTLVVGTGATDASSAHNPLPASISLCAVVYDRLVPTTPAAPGLAVPPPLSPDGDGTGDTTHFTLSVDAQTSAMRVELSRGPVAIATLFLPASAGAGTYELPWNGRDGTGRIVPDGYYAVTASAENNRGQRSPPILGVVRVDSAPAFIGVTPTY